MKQQLKETWNKLIDGSFVVGGCALMVVLATGAIHLFTLLGKWLWTLNWVKFTVRSIGQFLSVHSDLFEYIFVGTLFLWLFIGIAIFTYHAIKNGYKYAIAKDLFNKINGVCIKVAKIIGIILLIAVILLGIGKCVSYNEYNAASHIPSRYRS